MIGRISRYRSLLALLLLAACGGGGGGNEGKAPPPVARFAFVANLGTTGAGGDLSIFAVNATTGLLRHNGYVATTSGGGLTAVAVDPSSSFLYVTNNSGVWGYKIANNGALSPVSGSPFAAGTIPAAMAVDPLGRFVYVANALSNDVTAFKIDGTTGALSGVSGSPFPAGPSPAGIAIDPSGRFVYVTNSGNVGVAANTVSSYRIDAANGALTQAAGPVAAGSTPTGIRVDPTGRFVYVTSQSSATVLSYNITPGGGLNAFTSGASVPAGTNPCSISVDPSGKLAFVANQGSSDVSIFTIDNQGVLTPFNTVSTGGSTPFAVALDPTGQFAYTVNEGSGDITMFTVNPGGTLGSFATVSGRYSPGAIAFARGTIPVSRVPRFVYTANHGSDDVSAFVINPGSGALSIVGTPVSAGGTAPFSIAADPAGKYVYVGNEASNNVSAFRIDAASGALTAVQGQPFTAGTNPNGITVDSSGRFVYTANVNSNNISVFGIDSSAGPTNGALTGGTLVGAGAQPFSVTVDPSGRFLYAANLSSGNVSAYRISAANGALTPVTGSPFLLKVPATPFFITVNPSGKFVYVANWISGTADTVSVLSINLADGSLTELASSPVAAGKGSRSIAIDGAGKFVYVANEDDSTLSAYQVSPPGPNFGALNTVTLSPSPFTVGGALRPIATDISGKFVYVGNYGGSLLAAYLITSSTGQLSSIGSFSTVNGAKGIAPFGITTTGTVQ